MNYTDLPNLASPQLDSRIIFATDEWFAAAENVIKDEEAIWKQDDYTPFGKWMDGWESRRRRTEGHDWAIIQLGQPGKINAIEIDTAFFTGNFSPFVSVYGGFMIDSVDSVKKLIELREQSVLDRPDFGRMGLKASDEECELVSKLNSDSWEVLIPLSPLGAGYEATRKTIFHINSDSVVQFLRLNMGPDGGIARIRVYGEVYVSPEKIPLNKDIDLLFVSNGGLALSCSNRHYGHPRNLIAPGRGNCMGDGWETARQPKRPAVYQKGADGLMILPGYDWAVLQLGNRGSISSLEIDTHFYKGNYPESCLVEVCDISSATFPSNLLQEDTHSEIVWKTLLPRTRLGPDTQHFFNTIDGTLSQVDSVTHLKVTIYPDGGIMRIRAIGKKVLPSDL